MVGVGDQLAIIRSLLHGEALSQFEAALNEALLKPSGVLRVLAVRHLEKGLEAVKMVFSCTTHYLSRKPGCAAK